MRDNRSTAQSFFQNATMDTSRWAYSILCLASRKPTLSRHCLRNSFPAASPANKASKGTLTVSISDATTAMATHLSTNPTRVIAAFSLHCTKVTPIKTPRFGPQKTRTTLSSACSPGHSHSRGRYQTQLTQRRNASDCRRLPKGYLRVHEDGVLDAMDGNLRRYYEPLHDIIAGPLLEWERMVEIARFNLGFYDKYLETYEASQAQPR